MTASRHAPASDTDISIYLARGLDAMVRVFAETEEAGGGFVGGHHAAGMLAACFLFEEGLLDPGCAPAIIRSLDSDWMSQPIFAPAPHPAGAARVGIDALVEAMWGCMGSSSGDVHPVIFPSHALKTLRRHPELATQARIDGLCRMARLQAEQQLRDVATGRATWDAAYAPGAPPAPPPERSFDADAFSTWLLHAFADGVAGYRGHSQNLAGHILTYGMAVLDLHDLGYAALARKGEAGLRIYVGYSRQGQQGPAPMGVREREPSARISHPERAEYWEAMAPGSFVGSLAHATKYPCAYLQLMRRSTNAEAKRRAQEIAYVVLESWRSEAKAS